MTQPDIEMALKIQMVLTAFIMLPVIYVLATMMLPAEFTLIAIAKDSGALTATPMGATICAVMGTLGGLIIGLVTEYFTSHTYVPTQELASACKQALLSTSSMALPLDT